MSIAPDSFGVTAEASQPDGPDVRHVTTADVWKAGRLAATLKRTELGTVFTYASEYLAGPGPAVATTLPVSADSVITASGSVPPYFAGLLPEGRRLTALRDAIKTSLDDELSLLLAVGADPVGDVQILPAGIEPYVPKPSMDWKPGRGVSFRELLEDAHVLNRRGIAGVQDKASAAMITLPGKWSGHDAIVKFSPPEYPHLVENEAWFLGLAAAAGLTVPRHHVITDVRGERALVIERFDRMGAYEHPTRFAVEDGAQLLGLYPADKYRVTSEELAEALIKPCQSRVVAARDIFRILLFAWLTGNGDVHAKNISIVQREGEWRISPLYDLPSTLPYGDDSMALPIAGRDRDLSRRAFLEFAESIQIPALAAESMITSMLGATKPVIDLFSKREEEFTHPRNSESLQALKYRRRLLTQ